MKYEDLQKEISVANENCFPQLPVRLLFGTVFFLISHSTVI